MRPRTGRMAKATPIGGLRLRRCWRRREKSQRGRLKIFLGAAPGVGKTYEMLSAAQTRRREGVDVVIGVVETHGRTETEALTAGLEIIPRRTIAYRGRSLTEMDLDAILARRPRLVLVDELAHTNAPGSRHPKRYLDVEELLAAGIDVYTTLNIQHVESLNDVVARITRIRVRETVPDSVIERADDIELIDLTPDDLIQRLKDGKVYVPAQAERAVRHYFAPGNLTALRELALRRTAQRVDNQMVDYMRSHAIEGPWPAGERVLVCVQGGPQGHRHGAPRQAPGGPASRAVDRDPRRDRRRSPRARPAEQDSVVAALRLAQRLGAEPVLIPGQDVADTVIDYARANNVTHIIVGQVRPGALAAAGVRLDHPAADQPRRRDQHPCHRGAGRDAATACRPRRRPNQDQPLDHPAVRDRHACWWLLAIPVAMGVQELLGVTNVALVFLTAILIGAVLDGLGPSLLACFVAMLAYNFFFLPPLYTFTIADPENVVALFFFAVVAVIASNLAARVRGQAVTARLRARADRRSLSVQPQAGGGGDPGRPAVGDRAPDRADAEGARRAAAARKDGSVAVRAGFPPEDMLDDADLAAAKWCWEKNHVAGRGSDTLPGAKWLFQPMRTGRGPLGVVGIIRDEPGPLLTPDQQRLLDALADQAALAIERVNLARDLHLARLQVETDRLRSALADLDLARSAHAAGLDPRIRHQPAVAGRDPGRGRPRKRCSAPSSRKPIG